MLPLVPLAVPPVSNGKRKRADVQNRVQDGSRERVAALDPQDREHVQMAAVVAYTYHYDEVFIGLRDAGGHASRIADIGTMAQKIMKEPELMWMFIDLQKLIALFKGDASTQMNVSVKVIPKPGESYLVAFTEAALLLRPLPAPQQNTAYNTRNI